MLWLKRIAKVEVADENAFELIGFMSFTLAGQLEYSKGCAEGAEPKKKDH